MARARQRFTVFFASMFLASSLLAVIPTATAVAQPPPGQDFVISESDLAFILKQIQISEAHAEDVIVEQRPNASPLCGPFAQFDDGLQVQTWYEPDGDPCVGNPLLPHGLRTVDGRWNNLQPGQDGYGAASQVFPRLLEAELRDAQDAPPFAPVAPGQPTTPTSYAQDFGYVYDSQPRVISNLVVDQTTNNPAAVEVLLRYLEDGLEARIIGSDGVEIPIPTDATTGAPDAVAIAAIPNGRIFLQNVASDEGLSAPFSSWFTIFGQFFDHGLDLVEKGGSGTVVIPLEEDDPLWVEPSEANPNPPNFLMLTRATNQAGDDGILGTEDDVHEHVNRTTPFIDQNQTYTSHASHQVFLREYELVGGRPIPTGHLLNGANGGLATWLDVKTQARNVLGIDLSDYDVLSVPYVYTDPYGRFVADPDTGFPLVVMADGGTASGTPAAPLATGEVVGSDFVSFVDRANHSFLDDLAHESSPFAAGGDPLSRGLRDPETNLLPANSYDGDLLDDHFITGDGRGNENIALTAVHHVFHSEHNRLVGQIEAVLAGATPDLRSAYEADGYWDYEERLFQAARFVNEMEYQHLAIEEFVRRVQPTVDDPPLNEAAYHSELNAAITAEFAHVVYRFGHSMLTETLPRIYDDGTSEEMTLFDGFLNPRAFHQREDGTPLSPDAAAGSLVRGLTAQTGNAIDEMVTETLRNQLLGLPLDLATINLARGRDVGVPPLQAARATFYAATLDPTLEPYESWEDFRLSMKHPESIVNFVAAYGNHPTLDGLGSMADRRTAAELLVADADFMHASAAETGLDTVDFWVGGLAERTMPFGGLLGSTFNFVFESQGEHLQNADRFYYLTRNQGRNLFTQLEANSFSELVQRNTDADALPADVFAFPDPVFELSALPPCPGALPAESGLSWMADCTLRFTGGEHIVMYGTDGPDRMRAGDGDDSMWGRADDDRLEGGAGNDTIFGGDGDDIITDIFGDDTIMGGGGNDAIRGGPGGDLLLPGSGNDFTFHTAEITQSFSGPGNDFARGGAANDQMWGNEGDDWIEGGNGHDLVQGDHALVFQNDPNGGHDVLIGGPGNNDLDSDGGDDILVLGPGVDRAEGMLGFDWAIHKGQTTPVNADMRFTVLAPPDLQAYRDRFDFVEGLSGWNGNDVLRGSSKAGDLPEETDHGHYLTEDQLDRVEGLRDLLQPAGHINYAARFMDPAVLGIPAGDSDGYPNVILGGAGSDIIEGRAGDDFIDGDAWLNVQIERNNGVDPAQRVDGMLSPITIGDVTRSLGDWVFSGAINPGELSITRTIETPDDQGDVIDTAVYIGDRATYTITDRGDGYIEIFHSGADELEESEGRDIIRNIEELLFSDGCIRLDEPGFPACPTYGTITFDHEDPVEDEPIVATVEFNDGLTIDPSTIQFAWQFGEAGEEWEPSPNGNPAPDALTPPYRNTFHPGDAEGGSLLRVIVVFEDEAGQLRTIISNAVANEVVAIDDEPTGPVITPSNPTVGTMLQAGQLADGDGLGEVIEDGTLSWTWEHNRGTEDPDTWATITVTSEPWFLVTEGQAGRQIRVVARYVDDQGFDEEAFSEPTEIVPGELAENAAPSGAVALSSLAPQEGTELLADAAGIDDPDGIGEVSLQWQASADDGTTWDDIPGAVDEALMPTDDEVGSVLRAVATFVDGGASREEVVSATTAAVLGEEEEPANSAPTGSVTLSTDSPEVGEAVSATTSTLADADGLGELAFAWERSPDGSSWSPIDGAESSSYTPLQIDTDHHLRVTVSYVDGGGTSESVTSAASNPVVAPPDDPDPEPDATVTFTDIDSSKFKADIIWLAEEKITSGCSATEFCPKGAVTRGQMASFLARFLQLPAATKDYFVDDATNKHQANINRIAEAGITVGCTATEFCPDGLVTRAQMASFLVRALDLPETATDFFTDDDDNRHEDRINRLAASGITRGCGPSTFCPNGLVVREQMAAFIHRAAKYQVE